MAKFYVEVTGKLKRVHPLYDIVLGEKEERVSLRTQNQAKNETKNKKKPNWY